MGKLTNGMHKICGYFLEGNKCIAKCTNLIKALKADSLWRGKTTPKTLEQVQKMLLCTHESPVADSILL